MLRTSLLTRFGALHRERPPPRPTGTPVYVAAVRDPTPQPMRARPNRAFGSTERGSGQPDCPPYGRQ